MKIVVGTENKAKIKSVKIAFKKVFSDEKLEIVGVAVSSSVSDQPKSDRETIKGAITRAKRAFEQVKADYGVGLEGGLNKIDDKWFETGWAAIINKKGEIGLGSSIRMEVPDKIMKLIEETGELGYATDAYFKQKDTKHGEGFFGLMTRGRIDRAEGYAGGLISALSRFIHKNLY